MRVSAQSNVTARGRYTIVDYHFLSRLAFISSLWAPHKLPANNTDLQYGLQHIHVAR